MSTIAAERCSRCSYIFEEDDQRYIDLEGAAVCSCCHFAEFDPDDKNEEWCA